MQQLLLQKIVSIVGIIIEMRYKKRFTNKKEREKECSFLIL
jgi:hypothetical protein